MKDDEAKLLLTEVIMSKFIDKRLGVNSGNEASDILLKEYFIKRTQTVLADIKQENRK